MAAAPSAPIRVFICYIDDDDRYRRPLRTHLALLARKGLIELWDRTDIAPGTDALRAVKRATWVGIGGENGNLIQTGTVLEGNSYHSEHDQVDGRPGNLRLCQKWIHL
ncbi:MAG: hypothetical protein M3Z08_12390 [Chloroflexota bacterium]|nr:hypothetical protein [Chloroflexota bacterium]